MDIGHGLYLHLVHVVDPFVIAASFAARTVISRGRLNCTGTAAMAFLEWTPVTGIYSLQTGFFFSCPAIAHRSIPKGVVAPSRPRRTR
jgi:hypothetical protein